MLRVERDGAIAIWTVCRPEAKNALNYQTMVALYQAIGDASQDRTLRAAVLTGDGKTFVSGGDLRELRHMTSPADAAQVADMGRALCQGIAALDIPVIAALPGAAIGGGAELAIACDLRIADDRAKICFKQARMGLTTAWGVLPKLLAMVGPSTAARLLYTSHEIRAMEARALRLVDYVSDDGACVATALAWAMDIAQGSPAAVSSMKALLREASAPFEYLRGTERDRFVGTWVGPDHHEAVEAFFASRSPRWGAR